MPFAPSTVRNTREQFVLQKIEYYKVMEHISKSDWERHYFDTYADEVMPDVVDTQIQLEADLARGK